MKCDKLKAETIVPQGCAITLQMYPKSEVDAAIDELKTEHHKERDEYIEMAAMLRRENAELKTKLENVQASAYAESVDAGMRERRLRRALYKACAEWALSTLAWLDCIDQGNPVKWGEMRRKCLEKAEEYK